MSVLRKLGFVEYQHLRSIKWLRWLVRRNNPFTRRYLWESISSTPSIKSSSTSWYAWWLFCPSKRQMKSLWRLILQLMRFTWWSEDSFYHASTVWAIKLLLFNLSRKGMCSGRTGSQGQLMLSTPLFLRPRGCWVNISIFRSYSQKTSGAIDIVHWKVVAEEED